MVFIQFYKFPSDQVLDDPRRSCRCPDLIFFHKLYDVSRIIPGRRLCPVRFQADGLYVQPHSLGHVWQAVSCFFSVIRTVCRLQQPVYLLISLVFYNCPGCLKNPFSGMRQDLCGLVLIVRIKNRDQAGDNLVKTISFVFCEGAVFTAYFLIECRYQCMVVGYLPVIKISFFHLYPWKIDCVNVRFEFPESAALKMIRYLAKKIGGKYPAVRPGIWKDFMFFIKALCNLQRFIRCKSVLFTHTALQFRQVKQFRCFFTLFLPFAGYNIGFPDIPACFQCLICTGLFRIFDRCPFFVHFHSWKAAFKLHVQRPVWCRFKILKFLVTSGDEV